MNTNTTESAKSNYHVDADLDLYRLALLSGNPILLLNESNTKSDSADHLNESLQTMVIDSLLANGDDFSAILELRDQLRPILISKTRTMLEIDDAILRFFAERYFQ